MVGYHEATVIRVLAGLIVGELTKKTHLVSSALVDAFLEHYCEFPRVLFGYKMEAEAGELLKLAHQILIHEEFRVKLRDSCGRTL